MNFHDKLKALRIGNEMTQKELSYHLDISEVSIRNWETGSKKPSMTAIIAISKLFNVTSDYLLGIDDSDDKKNSNLILNRNEFLLLTNYRTLDKYGKKAVETLCSIEKERIESESKIISLKTMPSRYIPRYTTPSAAGYSVPLDGEDFEMLLVDDTVPNDADFAVIIQGDSMLPYIKDGDTVYVKKTCELSIGDIGIFSVNGAMYCKQYYIDNEQNLTLVSANPSLQESNIHIASNGEDIVRCYGKVLMNQHVKLPTYLFEKLP